MGKDERNFKFIPKKILMHSFASMPLSALQEKRLRNNNRNKFIIQKKKKLKQNKKFDKQQFKPIKIGTQYCPNEEKKKDANY